MEIDQQEIGRLRLVAQRIASPGWTGPAEAVRWMTALQAQDHDGVVTSVALRTADPDRRAVGDAFDAGRVVKSWPLRGTLHLVAAEDLTWMLALTAPRVTAGAARRRAELELDAATIERARNLAWAALSGGRSLRRDELLAHWSAGGLAVDRQRGYHLLWHLAQSATLCFGPTEGGELRLVLVDDWVTRSRRLERDEALAELARRYFLSHGPATPGDFGRWTGLAAADVRTAVALARSELARVEVDGVEHLLDPGTPDLLAAHRQRARGVFLLPGFDEMVLGYRDRTAILATEHAERIVPGRNGVFRPTVWSDGRIVGTWRSQGRGARRTVAGEPFTEFETDVAAALPELFAALPGR